MSKKVLQLFSLILSILALIFMIMSHYGIIRQYYLRHKPTEYYVDKYKSLPKADKDRVVVSFPYKNDIKVFLNSILDQTVRVDDIGTTTKNKDLKLSGAEKKVVNVYTYDKDYNDTLKKFMEEKGISVWVCKKGDGYCREDGADEGEVTTKELDKFKQAMTPQSNQQEKINTTNDKTYDYKLSNGKYYYSLKGQNKWVEAKGNGLNSIKTKVKF